MSFPRSARLRQSAPCWQTLLHLPLTAAFLVTPVAHAAEAGKPSAAMTATDTRDFNIPAQALATALSDFARQSGWQVSLESRFTAGHRTPTIIGSYPAAEALTQLLAGTGLIWRQAGNGSIVLEPAPDTKGALLLDAVKVQGTVFSEADQPYTTAGSSLHISRDKIERFRGTSVGDIFQGTTGVLIGENRNSGGLDVNIRGMQGQGRVPVLLDGSRQETTVYRGYAGVSSRSYIDPDLIGSIRIDKGPTLDAAGTGATGGLVSVSTIGANDILKPGSTSGLRIRASAASNNSGSAVKPGTPSGYYLGGNGGIFRTDCVMAALCEGAFDLANAASGQEGMNRPGLLDFKSWAGSIAAAKRLENMDLVAAYAYREQGNYYAGKHGPAPWLDLSERYARGFWTEVRPKVVGATRFRANERIVNSNFESESALLKGSFWLTDDQSLELGYQRYESTYGELMPSQLIWLGQIRQTESSQVSVNTYTSRYRWNPASTDKIDLRANLWHTDTKSTNENYSEGVWNDLFGIGTERYRRFGTDISNGMRFDLHHGLDVNYGVALQQETVANEEGGSSPLIGGARNGNRDEFSLFTSLQWKPLATLTVDAGLRHSRFKSEDDKPRSVASDSPYCVDNDGDGTCDLIMVSSEASGSAPLFSLTWDIRPGLQAYARYAEALRMPSLFETTSGFSVSPQQDIHLKPEHAKNREAGLNFLKDGLWQSDDKFRAKLAYFRNHTDDYLTRTLPNTWETDTQGRFFTLRNIQSVSFHGAELSGSYDTGAFFTEFGGTRYHFIETCHFGSYRRVECTNYGIAASYVNNMIPPKWHANLTLGARTLTDQRLEFGVRGTFMGKRTPTPPYNDQGVSGGFATPVPWHRYEIYDLFASYRVNDSLSTDFNIDNVTDQYYLDALSLGLVPAPGRSARIGLTVQF